MTDYYNPPRACVLRVNKTDGRVSLLPRCNTLPHQHITEERQTLPSLQHFSSKPFSIGTVPSVL